MSSGTLMRSGSLTVSLRLFVHLETGSEPGPLLWDGQT